MKIAVISDFHLGAKENTDREKDTFDQAKEAFEKAIDLGAQIILVAGDIFDSRIPKQEVWSEAMKILSKASEKENRQIKLDKSIGKDEKKITALPLRGVPVIAIHGNHERRGRGFVDSIEALESAGLLIRLHHNGVVLDSPDGKIAIQGMGYVPEQHARDLLVEWNPAPVKEATNIFMIHQGLGRFTYTSEERSELRPADLLKGFDLYISGHVHYKIESEVHDRPLIFPGSTFRTQLLPVEAENPKGFFMLGVTEGNIDYEFIELESVRDFFYEEKEFEGANPADVEDWIREKLNEFLGKPLRNEDKVPLVRIRLLGTLSEGSSRNEIDISGIEEEFKNKFLLSISRKDLSSPELEEKTRFLRDLREEKISMEERGMKLLEKNLEEMNYDQRFDPRMLFRLLSEDKVDEAFDKVSEEIDNLTKSALEERE